LTGDGKLLLTTGTKHVLSRWSYQWKLWDAATGKLIKTFDEPTTSAHAIHFAAGRKLALLECQPDLSDDSLLKLFDVEAGKTIRSFSREKEPYCGVAAFSPDGKFFILNRSVDGPTKQADGELRLALWDMEKDKQTQQFPVCKEGAPEQDSRTPGLARRLIFAPDGKKVLSADADGMLRLWDIAEGKLAWAVEADCEAAGFAAGGKEILLVRVTRGLGREQLYFQFRDAATGEQLRNR
jgi:WD40 repeat protein